MPRYNKETHEQFNLILTKDDMLKLSQQAKQLGLKPTEYIRLIISLDAATGIISALKDFTSAIEQSILKGSGISEPVGIMRKEENP